VTYLMEDLIRHLGEPVNPSYRRGTYVILGCITGAENFLKVRDGRW
jgi:hypothetical protein